jgi:ABC-type transport system substrate-binding protein
VQAQAVIATNWRRLGVEVEIVTQEINTYLANTLVPFDFDAAIVAIDIDERVPRLRRMWHSSAAEKGGYNVAGFATADALIERFEQTEDPDVQGRLGRELHWTIAGHVPFVFLLARTRAIYARRELGEVRGNAFEPLQAYPFADFQRAVQEWVRGGSP